MPRSGCSALHGVNPNLRKEYSSNHKRDKRPKLPLMNYLVKFLTKRKSQINNFTIARQAFF